MKKVLVVSNMYPDKSFPSYGIFVKNFCDQMEQLSISHELSVLTKKVGKVSKLSGYLFFYVKTFLKCIFGDYELVYVHYASFSSAPVLLANKIRKFDVYVNVHGSDVVPTKNSHRKMEKFTKRALSVAKRIIVPSDYFKDIVADKYRVSKNKIFIYPSGGVNLNEFTMYDNDHIKSIKQQYCVNENLCCVGYVSRIIKDKGWDTFLYAANKIISDGYDCEFVMVGSGEDDEKVADLLNELQLINKVKRLPQQSQDKLVEIYNMIDLFTFPTNAAESLGLVAIEAMACGCPVISSDFAAPGKYVVDGINGMKFHKGDYFELAQCVENYLDSSDTEHSHMIRGAISTASKFGTDSAIKMMKNIFSI